MGCGEGTLIFDAGTGLRFLGDKLAAAGTTDASIFLTHTHIDHINGLPFFGPLYNASNRIRFWAGHLLPDMSLHEALAKFMSAPLFPVPPQIFAADVSYHDFKAGETLKPWPDVALRSAPLNHPNNATGYRVDYNGHSICYITDTEHVEGVPDRNIINLVQGADLMIYDSTYTDDEYPRYRNWGHSTWQEGVRLANRANVKRLVVFHHDPSHDDAFMDDIAAQVETVRPGTVVAKEGMVLTP